MKVGIDAHGIVRRLEDRWSQPEWLTFRELRDGPGWDRRTADLVAVAAWDSGGQKMHVVEVKVSRGDWAKELAQPEKSEDWRKAAHWFWIAAPSGVIPLEEVPAGWGLLETAGDGIRAKRQAALNLTATGPTAEMWVMMLRDVFDRLKQSNRPDFAEFAGKSVSVDDLRRLAEKWHGVVAKRAMMLEEDRQERRKHNAQNWDWMRIKSEWESWITSGLGWKVPKTPEQARELMRRLASGYGSMRTLHRDLSEALAEPIADAESEAS